MVKVRKSKTDTRMFMDIPKNDEDEEDIKKKYKKVLGNEKN